MISTPAIELSARLELVPETKIKSPTRFVCGYAPLGVTVLLIIKVVFNDVKFLQLYHLP